MTFFEELEKNGKSYMVKQKTTDNRNNPVQREQLEVSGKEYQISNYTKVTKNPGSQITLQCHSD